MKVNAQMASLEISPKKERIFLRLSNAIPLPLPSFHKAMGVVTCCVERLNRLLPGYLKKQSIIKKIKKTKI